MRIAIQNPFSRPWVAEAALCHRIQWAATQLGWQATPARTAADIEAIAPDFVLALHNNDPKLAGYPTYGCMWNPPSTFEGTDAHVTNILSYDAYLISSPPIEQWLRRLVCQTPKPFLTAPFHTSCPQTLYEAPRLNSPRLFYCGSNWDGPRFKKLFELLDQQPYLDIYGHPDGWKYLNQSFRGPFPYDWVSVPGLIRQSGVGLCLHRQEHHDAAVPSLRIFEITAAGAVAICGDHPFIRHAFGDAVLYIDPTATPEEQFQQIDAHMTWIAAHPDRAREMTWRAHQIFSQRYALENLLQTVRSLHESVLRSQGYLSIVPTFEDPLPAQAPQNSSASLQSAIPQQTHPPRVYYFLRTHSQCLDLPSRLSSLADQSYPHVVAVLLPEGEVSETEQAVEDWRAGQPEGKGDRLPIHILQEPPSDEAAAYRSTALWQALQFVAAGKLTLSGAVHAETNYFGVLDHAILHRNHVQRLVTLLTHSSAGLAYSGGLPLTPDPLAPLPETTPHTPLLGFQPFHLLDFWQQQQLLIPDAFLCRLDALSYLPTLDPQLNQADLLCVLMCLCRHQQPIFSYEATCKVNPTMLNVHQFIEHQEQLALRMIFWHQELTPGLVLQPWGHPIRLNSAVQPLPHLKDNLHHVEHQLHQLVHQLVHQLEPQFHQLQQQQQNYQATLGQYQQQLEILRNDQRQLQEALTHEIQHSKLQGVQLREAHNQIEAMESSKFWRLRRTWFRVKRLVGLKGE